MKYKLDKSRKISYQKGYTIKGSRVRGSKNLLFRNKTEANEFVKKVGGKAVKGYRKSVPVIIKKKKGWASYPKVYIGSK